MDKLLTMLNEIVKRAPVLVLGVIVLVIAAAGSLPIGNPPLQFSGAQQSILGIVSLVIIGVGLWVVVRDRSDTQQSPPKPLAEKLAFHPVSLPETHRFSLPWGNENPPLRYTCKGIEFSFRPGNDGRPEGLRVPDGDEVMMAVDIPKAKGVFILLNSEYAFKELGNGVAGRHQEIGEIVLNFSDKGVITEPLILGVNIRDWYLTNPSAITELEPNPKAIQAWHGPGERDLVMDMLSIELPKAARLETITIRSRLRSNRNPVHKPNILIWAISCKVV